MPPSAPAGLGVVVAMSKRMAQMHERYVFFRSAQNEPPEDRAPLAAIVEAYLDALGRLDRSNRPVGRVVREMSPDFCLVEMSASGAQLMATMRPAVAADLRRRFPDVGCSVERQYRPAFAAPARQIRPNEGGSRRANQSLKLRIVDLQNRPIANASLRAFDDFRHKRGAEGRTGPTGRVSLPLGSPTIKLQHLSIYLQNGRLVYCRTAMQGGFSVRDLHPAARIAIDPDADLGAAEPFVLRDGITTLGWCDALRADCYARITPDDGSGVVVALVDSGVDVEHPFFAQAAIDEMACFEGDDSTAGPLIDTDHHGTHLASIITGLAGLAPSSTLRSFRVFRRGRPRANTGAVAEGILGAVDGEPRADLINLSISSLRSDVALVHAIRHARSRGALVLAAAGNDYRRRVSYPGQDLNAIAVSAFGIRHSYPPDSDEAAEEAEPYAKSSDHFVARSSSIGYKVALTGPGVGIISAERGGGVKVFTGTSQACASVVALAARVLSKEPSILKMERNWARSVAIENLVLQAASRLGFSDGPTCPYEGRGLIE